MNEIKGARLKGYARELKNVDGINPLKAELMLFITKTKVPHLSPLNGRGLTLPSTVNYVYQAGS